MDTAPSRGLLSRLAVCPTVPGAHGLGSECSQQGDALALVRHSELVPGLSHATIHGPSIWGEEKKGQDGSCLTEEEMEPEEGDSLAKGCLLPSCSGFPPEHTALTEEPYSFCLFPEPGGPLAFPLLYSLSGLKDPGDMAPLLLPRPAS